MQRIDRSLRVAALFVMALFMRPLERAAAPGPSVSGIGFTVIRTAGRTAGIVVAVEVVAWVLARLDHNGREMSA